MPKRHIITTSQGFLYKDELEKSNYKAKPKGWTEDERITDYKAKREKVFALMDEGYKMNEIKVMLKL